MFQPFGKYLLVLIQLRNSLFFHYTVCISGISTANHVILMFLILDLDATIDTLCIYSYPGSLF